MVLNGCSELTTRPARLILLVMLLSMTELILSGAVGGLTIQVVRQQLQIRELRVDDVTGALIRSFGMSLLRERLRDCRPGGLLFVDLDDFGRINKLLGWLAGDRRLRAVTDQMYRHLRRQTDFIFRYGGDEQVGWYESEDVDVFHEAARALRAELRGVASVGYVHTSERALRNSGDGRWSLTRLLEIAQNRARATKWANKINNSESAPPTEGTCQDSSPTS